VVAHDVTDQRRLQAVVEHAAHVWRQTFDAADPALLILDKDSRVIRLNRAAQDLLGRSYNEIVGSPLTDLSKNEPWPSASVTHERARSSGETQTAQAHDPAKGQTWALTVKPLPPQGDEGTAVLSVHDITRLVQLQESLRRTEMMSALGGLVAGVAHEVRNPLFSISATLDNLEGQLSTNPDFVQYAALLRSQVARLSHLMRDLLDYGKPARLQITSSKPADLIRRAVRSCALLARECGVTIDEEAAPKLPSLQVDGARMLQVFENLVSNAIQHSERGSHVRVTAERSGSDVLFRVEDSGPGIPPEDLPLLFDPFFSRRKEGTGLGLSIAQRIVDAHGGRIAAANRPEGGAAFSVRIPFSGDQAHAV
jgi:PAS domain S-box-containing protein